MNHSAPTARWLALLLCVLASSWFTAPCVFAQERLPTPWASPRATVGQTVGLTDVTLTFHRPGVKGRDIWGALVPWNRVWRCGANDNTTFRVDTDVMVEGKRLAAGTYGLHMIPTPESWTVIFSRNASSWGSFFYRPEEDVLRVQVHSVEAPFKEWLSYDFENLAADGATCVLRWERMAVPFRITVDTHAAVLTHARERYLRNLPAFSWQGWNNAASYCLDNDVNLEEGLGWADESIARGANFTNMTTKTALLEKLGRRDQAAAVREQALAVATEAELISLGYKHLRDDRLDRAIAIFESNVANHPDSWNAHDSLAEALMVAGQQARALEHYHSALALVEDPAQQRRIRTMLDGMEQR